MKHIFKPGDVKYYRKVVTTADLATFAAGQVHPVCATFALAREMEWASRLFVLEMLDEDEEGIGTQLSIKHLSPALAGEELQLEARVQSLAGHEILCALEVKVGDRLIATGVTGQKILKKSKIAGLLRNINHGGKEK